MTVHDDPARHRFEAVDESGVRAGILSYTRHGHGVVITHTAVEDAFEDRGVGSALARVALDAIRADGLTVDPQCPFVRGWIDRHPDYADLVT